MLGPWDNYIGRQFDFTVVEVSFRVSYGAPQVMSLRIIGVNLYRRTPLSLLGCLGWLAQPRSPTQTAATGMQRSNF